MAGRPNTKWKETMLAKFGSEEALREHMSNVGRKGGQRPTTGGFAADRELAKRAGALGGSISKRKKKNEPTQ